MERELLLDACVVLASGKMSADRLDRARDTGRLTMKRPLAACLEVGGVVVAEGRIRKRRGKSVFVVTRAYRDGSEVSA